MSYCNKPCHVFKGEVRTVKFIAECLGIAEHTLRHRWKVCKEKGWPESKAYEPTLWSTASNKIRIECPDGKTRDLEELGDYLDVHPETVRGRLRILKRNEEPASELFNLTRWRGRNKKHKYGYDASETVLLTPEEKMMLERIPGPSELEKRIFG